MSDGKELPPLKLSDLAFSVKLGKRLSEYKTNPPHVKAARMLQERGVSVGIGDIIKYVWTKDGVKPLELATFREIDRGKYAGYLRSMVEQILDAFDMDYDEIIGLPRQTSLASFIKIDGNGGESGACDY